MAKKSSLLDHIYVTNPATVLDTSHYLPPFGDHLLVTAKLIFKMCEKEKMSSLKRDWKNYSESVLNNDLIPAVDNLMSSHYITNLNAQEYWNCFENIMIEVIDKHAPLCQPQVMKKIVPSCQIFPLQIR